MIRRALDAGLNASWVTGDEVYGGNPHLRQSLEDREIGYVMAAARSDQIATHAGRLAPTPSQGNCPGGPGRSSPPALAPKDTATTAGPWPTSDTRLGHLLIRRNRRTGELAFYRTYSPLHDALFLLVKAAGRRWTVEEAFQAGKGLAGLDDHRVRTWTSWHRWVTFAMLAHAFLTAVTASEHVPTPPPDRLLQLTCNEIQHLFTTLTATVHTVTRLRWSTWRRRHQARPPPATTNDKPPKQT